MDAIILINIKDHDLDKILVHERPYEKKIFIDHVAYKNLKGETTLELV